MQQEEFKFLDTVDESTDTEKILIDNKSFRNLFYYSDFGLKGLRLINNKDIEFLSDESKKGIYIAKYSYLNIVSELKKAEAVNLVNNFKLERSNILNQSVNVKLFTRKLCRRITSIIGDTANLKLKFTSDVDKDVLVQCDGSILQFVLTNCIAVIASNTDKEKRIINVHIEENRDNVSIKLWNKYAFRLDKKVIDRTDALKMYTSDYELEQMLILSNSLISLLNGNVETIVEDNISKTLITLRKNDEATQSDVSDFEDIVSNDMQIVIPFSDILLKIITELDKLNEIKEFVEFDKNFGEFLNFSF